jgi:hypothetical protein
MNQAGKGDTPRKVDAKTYGENYDAIFRKEQDQPPDNKPADGRICACEDAHCCGHYEQ